MQSIKPGALPAAGPFVKWAGGKTQLLSKLDVHIPAFRRYFEPFLGGGSLFFHLASRQRFTARLSDSNRELVNAYVVVKNNVEGLITMLQVHEKKYATSPTRYYYELRSTRPDGDLESAARFIALNKTCYNGLFRVNRGGEFNVPIGRYRNPRICDKNQLRRASATLRYTDARIVACDYKAALTNVQKGDLVYLDPPFNPLSPTACFVDYTTTGFGKEDQIELAQTFKDLDRKGCMVLLSNSYTPFTRKLYSGFHQSSITARRAISCRSTTRAGYLELLVRNYGSPAQWMPFDLSHYFMDREGITSS